MLRNLIYLCFCLQQCSSPTRCSVVNKQDIEDSVNRYVTIVEDTSDDKYFQVSVVFGDNGSAVNILRPYEIVASRRPIQEQTVVDQAYALYIVTNCKVALWLIQRMSDFVEESRLFYRNEFQNYDNSNDEPRRRSFEKNMKSLIDDVNANAVPFISILNDFLETYSDSSLYMDTDVLKALLSLKIRLNLISSARSEPSPTVRNESADDYGILRMLLGEINAVRRFSHVNCEYAPQETRISQLFGLRTSSVGGAESADDVKNLAAFLSDGIGLGSVDASRTCSARQIFLEDFVRIPSDDDVISMDIGRAEINVAHTSSTVSVEDISEHVKHTHHDVDVALWYCDTVLAATAKLLYRKTGVAPRLTARAESKVAEIGRRISENANAVPKCLVQGIRRLARYCSTDSRGKREYFENDPVRNIKFNERGGRDDRPGRGGEADDDDDVYAERLVTRILDRFDDISCAHEHFKSLRQETDMYCSPGVLTKRTLLENIKRYELQRGRDGAARACGFVSAVYGLNSRARAEIDAFGARASARTVSDRVRGAFDEIKNVCAVVVKREWTNYGLVKMAYDILVVLENLQTYGRASRAKKAVLFLYERISDIITTELNAYSIEYCSASELDNLLSNYVDFNESADDRSALDNYISTFFEQRYNINKYDVNKWHCEYMVKSTYFRYFNIDYLYTEFISNSEVVKYYGHRVLVYWNRRLQSIENIFLDARELTLSPQNLFALYDIYFKFYLAAIYYEFKMVLKETSFKTLKKRFVDIQNKLKTINIEFFPIELSPLISDLKIIYYFPSYDFHYAGADESEAIHILRNKELEMNEQFRNFNFVFAQSRKKEHKLSKIKSMLTFWKSNSVSLISKELRSKVNNLKAFFFILKR